MGVQIALGRYRRRRNGGKGGGGFSGGGNGSDREGRVNAQGLGKPKDEKTIALLSDLKGKRVEGPETE